MKTLGDILNQTIEEKLSSKAAVVAAHHEHVLAPIIQATNNRIIRPILIGEEAKIRSILQEHHVNTVDFEIINSASDEESAQIGVELAKNKKADILVKGLVETGVLMKQVVNKDRGIARGKLVSVAGIFESNRYHKLFIMTDMGMNISPDLNDKIAIVNNAVGLAHSIGIENPKVAMLGAAEKENPKMPDTLDSARIKVLNQEGAIAGCIIEGPISLDLAISKEAAAIKSYHSPVAGDADILVVPDIVSGNLLIKGMGMFGDLKNADVVLGCEVPIVFGSRGGPAEGKYRSLLLAVLIANRMRRI